MNKKKISRFFSAFIYTLTAVLLILVIYLVYMKASNKIPSFFGNCFMQIISPSMEPEIKVGSYIIVQKQSPEEIKSGDIITFYSNDPAIKGQPNTHRVVEIKMQNDEIYFVTKGDNNPVADDYMVKSTELIGKYTRVSAIITAIGGIFNNKFVFLFVVIIPAALFLIFEIINVIKKAKKLKEEELIQIELEKLKSQNDSSKEYQGHGGEM